jgi:hypothetical protein
MESPEASAARVVTGFRAVLGPVSRVMVQPLSQPEYLRGNSAPASRFSKSPALLRSRGLAMARVAEARTAKVVDFILTVGGKMRYGVDALKVLVLKEEKRQRSNS